MNLRRLDVRMALPVPPRSAVVLGNLPEWREGLRTAGVELHDPSAMRSVDLTVAPARLVREALAGGSPMLIFEGRGARRPLRSAGVTMRRFLPLPPGPAPDLLVPLEERAPTTYALGRLRSGEALGKRARNAGVAATIALRAFPDLAAVQTVALRVAAQPFLLERASAFGIPPDSSWFQTMGHGDALTRGVFHLFAPRARKPQWVVKFARIPGYAAPFEADERGLRHVAEVGGTAAAHAPRLLGRFNVGGFEASAETAIVGEPLSRTLAGAAPRAQRLALVERIAAWTSELARATRASPSSLQPELRRLREEVLPHWIPQGAPADLVERLPALSAVLAHNDLGTWNVIVDGAEFGAVDWESATRQGLPLWDLLYFLVDALAILDGARSVAERVDGSRRLLRGVHPHSEVLFRWVAISARAAGVPLDAVGPVSTLCWLHHGLSHVGRWSAAEKVQPGSGTFIPPAEQIASHWLQDPALGVEWPAWRAYVSATG